MKKALFIITGFALFSCQEAPDETQTTAPKEQTGHDFYPERKGEINDFEDLLSGDEEENLQKKLREVKDSTGYDVVIATFERIPSDMDIVGYANDLGNRWEVGNPPLNKGVVIAVSEEIGAIGIAPGKRLEQTISNTEIRRVIDEKMVPPFTQGEYYIGLRNALNELLLIYREEVS